MRILERIRHRSPRIPRTNILADIAAEHMITHRSAILFRNRSTQFDRPIRDAAPCVDRPPIAGGNERIRRTRIDAARARPASFRRRRIRLQFERRDQLAQKKPRSHRLINQTRVPADPTEPRQTRKGPLQHRRGIDARFPFEGSVLAQPRCEPFERFAHHIVIIATPRISRNGGVRRRCRRAALVVQFADADHRFRRRQKIPHIAPQITPPIGQITHFARHPLRSPRLVSRKILGRIRRCDSGEFESALAGKLLDEIGRQISW